MFETVSIILTLIGCTWTISQKLNTFVTHSVCEKRRENCPCHKDVEELKNAIKKKGK